jgi:heme-degrading monooxygenase HmoA
MLFELAQLNVGHLLAPLEDEQIAGFVAALEPVNAAADTAPGFVWRLQTEDGDATGVQATPDPLFLVNLSVWESVEALAAFVYDDSGHRSVMRGRRQWFDRLGEVFTVLWWVPAGTPPTVAEALDRLDRLRRDGPTAEAFTFRRPFPPPDDPAAAPEVDDR